MIYSSPFKNFLTSSLGEIATMVSAGQNKVRHSYILGPKETKLTSECLFIVRQYGK
jgi:hypothetical protein